MTVAYQIVKIKQSHVISLEYNISQRYIKIALDHSGCTMNRDRNVVTKCLCVLQGFSNADRKMASVPVELVGADGYAFVDALKCCCNYCSEDLKKTPYSWYKYNYTYKKYVYCRFGTNASASKAMLGVLSYLLLVSKMNNSGRITDMTTIWHLLPDNSNN